ncbi:MAG: Hsp70 family protein [Bacillota bacterium]|nr:Hsp70 family protein [Bacillota bacterium]
MGIAGEKLAPFINKSTKLPCKKSYTFSTTEDNQKQIALKLYQGVSEDLNYDSFLGEFRINILKLMPAGKIKVEVTIELINSDIVIYAKDLNSKNDIKVERVMK